jgi:hypothetical protein
MMRMTGARMDQRSVASLLTMLLEAMKDQENYDIHIGRLGATFVVSISPDEEEDGVDD